eukprot:m51a1_g826 hypothetical protein (307) ;mRNA; f:718385-719305
MNQPGPRTFKALFLNAHLFQGAGVAWIYWPLVYRDHLRADEIASRALRSGADVFALAEVWPDSLKQAIAKACSATYPHAWWPPRGPGVLVLGSGLMVLSKHPIDATAFVGYKRLCGADYMSRKGAAYVRTGGADVFWTHVQANSSPKCVEYRRENLAQLAQFVRGQQKASEAAGTPAECTVVLGDFNVCETAGAEVTQEYRDLCATLAGAGLVDALRALHPSHRDTPATTNDAPTNGLVRLFTSDSQPPQRLDYAFVPQGAAVQSCSVLRDWVVVDESKAEGDPLRSLDASDHYPIEIAMSPQSQN